ncbi:MAG: PEP-CTERM sorting domain-containing protein [Planctomycetota bacterium]
MFRKFLFVGLTALISASADAGVVSSLLSFNGNSDVLTDDSVGLFVENGTVDNVLEVGDYLQGMISFDPLGGNAVPAGSSVIGAYSLEVVSIGAGGSSLELRGASGADSITSILAAAGVDMSGLSGSFAGQDNGFVLLESSTVDVDRTDFVAGPFGFDVPVTGADFDAIAVLGFDGVDDQHTVTAAPNALTPLDPFDVYDLTDLATAATFAGSGVPFASFFGTYSITDHAFGSGVQFLPVQNLFTGGFGDVTILNGSISGTNADTEPNGWDYNDDGDFNINAVPEPGTVIGFALLGVSGALSRRRRRLAA